MMRSVGVLFKFTFLLLILPEILLAQIPREISYQGVLTDSSGIPKPDGSYAFVFALYSDSAGVNSLWSSGITLSVKSGLFSTVLSFPPTVTFDRKYWLGIVANGVTLSPRIPLSSAAYSISSIRSDTAGYSLAGAQQAFADSARIAGTVPNGAITMSHLAPSGAATGQVIKWTGSAWAPRSDSVGAAARPKLRCGLLKWVS